MIRVIKKITIKYGRQVDMCSHS